MMNDDPLALLPEIALLTGAIGGLLLGLWTPRRSQGRVAVVTIVACVASSACAVAALDDSIRVVFGGTWTIDLVSNVVRIIVAAATIGAIVLLRGAFAGNARETEVYVLAILAALGANALASSSDILMLVASFLLASVPLYTLAGFRKDSAGTEAALKYYLMSALVGVVLLVGAAALILATGYTAYGDLRTTLPGASIPLVALGVLAVLAAVMFTAGAVPVHFWVPDVTAGTTPAVAALVTTIPKIGALAAIYRLMVEAFVDVPLNVPLVIAVVAAASMTWGNLGAFGQQAPQRLLAYSTISQVGYLLMAVAVAAQTNLAEPAFLIYLGAYAVTNLGAFAAAAALPHATTLQAWATGAVGRPWLVVSLVVVLLGLVGTPPTAVFVGKLAVFTAAADGGMPWLLVLAAVNSVMSLFYYLRWIAPAVRSAWSTSPSRDSAEAVVSTSGSRVLHACAGIGLVGGITAGVLVSLVP